jgi:hypothetical protein
MGWRDKQPRCESAYSRLVSAGLTNGDGLLQQARALEPGEAIEFESRGVVYLLLRPTDENLEEFRRRE